MLKLVRPFVALFVLILAVFAHADNVVTGKVVKISAGDTIIVLENRTQYKIRLYKIDCPERRQSNLFLDDNSISRVSIGITSPD